MKAKDYVSKLASGASSEEIEKEFVEETLKLVEDRTQHSNTLSRRPATEGALREQERKLLAIDRALPNRLRSIEKMLAEYAPEWWQIYNRKPGEAKQEGEPSPADREADEVVANLKPKVAKPPRGVYGRKLADSLQLEENYVHVRLVDDNGNIICETTPEGVKKLQDEYHLGINGSGYMPDFEITEGSGSL